MLSSSSSSLQLPLSAPFSSATASLGQSCFRCPVSWVRCVCVCVGVSYALYFFRLAVVSVIAISVLSYTVFPTSACAPILQAVQNGAVAHFSCSSAETAGKQDVKMAYQASNKMGNVGKQLMTRARVRAFISGVMRRLIGHFGHGDGDAVRVVDQLPPSLRPESTVPIYSTRRDR